MTNSKCKCVNSYRSHSESISFYRKILILKYYQNRLQIQTVRRKRNHPLRAQQFDTRLKNSTSLKNRKKTHILPQI